MNGEHPGEALSAYLDGELEAAERRRVEEHVGACGACARLLGDLRRLMDAAREEEIPPAPADLPDRVLARLGGKPVAAPRRRRSLLFRVPMAAAASLAAVAVLWVVWRQEPALHDASPESLSPGAMDAMEAPDGSPAAVDDADEDKKDGRGANEPVSLSNGRADLDTSFEEKIRRRGEVGSLSREVLPRGEPPEASATDEVAAASVDSRADVSAAAAKVAGRIAPAEGALDAERRTETGTRDEVKLESALAVEGDVAAANRELEDRSAAEPPAAPGEPTEVAARQQFAAEPPGAGPGSLPFADTSALPSGTWVLRTPEHSILMAPDGSLVLRATGYECTLPAAADEGVTQEMRAALATEAERRRSLRIAGGEVGGDAVLSPSPVLSKKAPRWSLAILEPDGQLAPIASTDLAGEIGDLLRTLVRERYTPERKETCGPLPAPFLEPED